MKKTITGGKLRSTSPQSTTSNNSTNSTSTTSSSINSVKRNASPQYSPVVRSGRSSRNSVGSPRASVGGSPQHDELSHSIETITPIKRTHDDSSLSDFEDSPNTKTLYNEQQDLRERVDQYLKEAFENRLASMMNLRVQMEELASAHKQEEDNYVQTIREILRRSTFENERRREVESNLKGKLNEAEGKLKTEFIEKQKTYEEFQNFKEKGTSIIYRLRDSLKKITEKYKEEKQKNSSLKKQLKECEDAWEDEVKKRERFENIINERQSSNDIIWQEKFSRMKEKNVQLLDEIQALEEKLHIQQGNAISASSGEVEDWKKKEKVFETKIKEFQRLLEEEESLIEDLKRKLSLKTQENSELSKELERFKLERGMSKEILETTSVDIPKEYLDVYTEIKGLLDPEDNKNLHIDANPQEKIKAQNRFIRLLLSKLKSEEHNRVKTHEENISIVLEQEKTISFLEKKIRELENIVIEQKDEAQKESIRISKLVKGEQLEEDGSDDGKLKELEEKLDIITQEMNNSIRSIQEAREEKTILEEHIEDDEDDEFTTHSLRDETEPLYTHTSEDETEEIIEEERISTSDNSQDELIADCKEDDEDV